LTGRHDREDSVRNLGRSIVRLAISLAILGVPASAQAQIPKYEALIVFGDNISDTGNLWILTKSLGVDPAIPPSESPHRTYYRGRFSNGPILFEHFWARLSPTGGPVIPSVAITGLPSKGAVSFAYGGAESGADCFPSTGLLCQVGQFAQALGGTEPPRRALYAVFAGANDVLNAPDPLDPAVVSGIVANVSTAIQQLYQLGARDVVVLNMPNLGLAPLIAVPEAKALLDLVAQQHNAALASALASLSNTLPGIRIIPVDLYGYLQSLVASSSFDFETTAVPAPTSYCLFDGAVPTGINCLDVPTFHVDRSYFFWDVEHPTKAGHAAFAAFVYQTLEQYFAH
jgi:phospholipase/lecithinase/hemolysin